MEYRRDMMPCRVKYVDTSLKVHARLKFVARSTFCFVS
jgi:hypothetical protein